MRCPPLREHLRDTFWFAPTVGLVCTFAIVQFLAAVVRMPLGPVHHRDRAGTVRLVQEGPGWADLVDLAFEEIRWCATRSPQVSRRMPAGIDDLLVLAPEGRKGVLVRHRTLPERAVERTVSDVAEREFALVPDRQGIG